jgi:hypothetical protein
MVSKRAFIAPLGSGVAAGDGVGDEVGGALVGTAVGLAVGAAVGAEGPQAAAKRATAATSASGRIRTG